jgi:hypothetical protein
MTRMMFGALFRKYRLKAQITTLAEFGRAFGEKGMYYEESIFSHWQQGTRVPHDRKTVLKLIELFIEKKAIENTAQANALLSSTDQEELTDEELSSFINKLKTHVFQVPNEVTHFTNRDEIISNLINNNNLMGKVVYIHGPAGVGKTALAIKLGHSMKENYTDGVLWYKVEQDNIMDILLSIAHIYGEDVSKIHDKYARATIVRTLLADKNTLIILDSAELSDDIHLLLPTAFFSTFVITSQSKTLEMNEDYIDIPLKPFSNEEVIRFFKTVLKNQYPKGQIRNLLKISERVNNLPLALDIIAKQLLHYNVYLNQLPTLTQPDSHFFHDLYKENKNLYSAIEISYNKLDVQSKTALISAAIFKGKDFSNKSIAYMNGFSQNEISLLLENLVELSLLEHSTKLRYRMHPTIQEFIRNKLNYPRSSYLKLIAASIFIFLTLWWLYIQLVFEKNSDQHFIFSSVYGIMGLYGAVCGIHIALKWGGLKTLMGKAISMFSFGLFMQQVGQVVYTYYALKYHSSPPYPSWGDIGYFGTIPIYTYGAFLLGKSSGIKINLQLFRKKLVAILVPLATLTFAYISFLHGYKFDWSNPIKIFLDFGYPLGEACYISIAIIIFILSRGILDGLMKSKALLILFALGTQFIADYTFIFTASIYYPGNYVCFAYLVAYFFMTIALLSLKSIRVNVKS